MPIMTIDIYLVRQFQMRAIFYGIVDCDRVQSIATIVNNVRLSLPTIINHLN
jgi:hypothetical protein